MTIRIDVRPSPAPIVALAGDGPAVRGAADALPVLAGLAPLGLALGAAFTASSADRAAAWATTPLVYGASAQLAAVTTLAGGSAAVAVVATVLAVNIRLLFYSASLRGEFADQPAWFRWFGPQLIVDPLFALVVARRPDLVGRDEVRRYYLGAGVAIWAGWQALVTLGMVVGPAVPPSLSLGFALPTLMVGFLVPAMRGRPAVTAALIGAAVALAGRGLPYGGGLLAAFVAGAFVATLQERGGRPWKS